MTAAAGRPGSRIGATGGADPANSVPISKLCKIGRRQANLSDKPSQALERPVLAGQLAAVDGKSLTLHVKRLPESIAFVPFDQRQLWRAFATIAAGYDRVAVLQQEVGRRLDERLGLVKLRPRRLLDVGCATGFCTDLLLRRYRQATVLAVDLQPAMLRRARRVGGWRRRPLCVAADAARLPLAGGSCELVFANLMLHWCGYPERVLSEFRRLLRPGGLLMFSTFGPDTLTELRHSWAAADDTPHVHPFIDMHDLGDMLLAARLADPVMDVEHFTLTYRELTGLTDDLRQGGAGNALCDRRRSLTGKRRYAAMRDVYRQRYRTADGLLPATFEVVYGHAWAPSNEGKAPAGGEVKVPMSSLRRRR